MNYLSSAERTIGLEADAIASLRGQLSESFARACQLCLDCSGRVVVTGMGKSGHIGQMSASMRPSTKVSQLVPR